MSERIHEVIVITRNPDGSAHLAPMGVRQRDTGWLIAPFKPSRTLENLLREGVASINTTDDVRVYAGCLTRRPEWPMVDCEQISGLRLRNALSHREVRVRQVSEDPHRPELLCETLYQSTHRPFNGYNRAQAAVIELAILVSRLQMLSAGKIDSEIAYLEIAIDKTAGSEEREAWDWLMQRVQEFRKRQCA